MIFDKKVILIIASIALLFIFPLGLLVLWALFALNLAITSVYGAKNNLDYDDMTATEKTFFHYQQYLATKQDSFKNQSTLNNHEQEAWAEIVNKLSNE
jgi:hypothetical protein